MPGRRAEEPFSEIDRALVDKAQSNDFVVALVSKLVSRNEELERMLASIRQRKNSSEGVSTDQLDDKLRDEAEGDLAEANEKLEEAAKKLGGRPKPEKPPKQPPPVRRPPPPGLSRVPNPTPVPEADRPCPICGAERTCIGHETTRVIDLIPAEAIVRLDEREVLACDNCEAALVRAPLGDKVIAGGAYGSRLVAELVVGKYWDGLPLHRQGQQLRLDHLHCHIPVRLRKRGPLANSGGS
jgi:transposase